MPAVPAKPFKPSMASRTLAGSVEPAEVRDAIENLKGFAGTAGVFNFSPSDHNGLDMSSFEMLTVKDGKFTLLKP